MTVKKITWRSILPVCYKAESLPAEPKKKLVTKQSSFQRLSISDLSNPSSSLSVDDISNSLIGSNLHIFTLGELRVITQSFSSSNFLGEGGFGPVHKGFIDDKMRPGLKAQPVAVKLLDLDGSQGHREWLTLELLQGFDDIPVGPFVYTAPTENEKEDDVKDKKGGEAHKEEVKKENDDRHHRHHGHRQRNRSPRSPTVYSDTALYKNLRNGLNSPMHNRGKWA
ncbi:hypothetical protein HHK36_025401 [Tetracentron sinense]|uniref:Uncharacterized protein n=1 Tax=Tetracentron sinense TaxID=13715 RepID=A0A834YKC9_TETSI|nr:hypothetical protein HHK36_025401 [Tetracentron sinense]